MAATGLTAKQRRFVEEYLIDLNATQAAIRAGYSARRADAIGYENLRKPEIAAAVAAAQEDRSRRLSITADGVLRELASLCFSSVSHFGIDDRGNVVTLPDAPERAMQAVSAIRKKAVHRGGEVEYTTELKLWSKPAALRLAAQHLGMLKSEEAGDGAVVQINFVETAPPPPRIIDVKSDGSNDQPALPGSGDGNA